MNLKFKSVNQKKKQKLIKKKNYNCKNYLIILIFSQKIVKILYLNCNNKYKKIKINLKKKYK